MERIQICGGCGAGKSTLGRRLADRLALVHLRSATEVATYVTAIESAPAATILAR
jgi:adenylate kinase family enzyme